jgi:hypothetical protein
MIELTPAHDEPSNAFRLMCKMKLKLVGDWKVGETAGWKACATRDRFRIDKVHDEDLAREPQGQGRNACISVV